MIGALTKFVLQNPFVAILGTIALLGAGVRSYLRLPIDAVPDVTNVQVQVLTSAPGLSPIEVERMVTQPVELAMTGLVDVDTVRSVSRAGISAVTIVFADHVDIHHAREVVSQRLTAAREAIPESAGRPEIGPLTTGLGEIFHFTVRWPGHSPAEIRTLLEWDIAYRLRATPGVVEVNPWGRDLRQIEIRVRPDDLVALGITSLEVENAVLAAGHNVSAGAIERDEEGTFVRLEGAFAVPDDVARLVVAAPSESPPVLVRDVADVIDGAAPRLSAATADGEGETVYAMVQMVAGGNAHRVVADVQKRLEEITLSLPEGVAVEPFYDRAAFVDDVLGTVRKNLLEGGLVVALVLLLMLGNVRAGLLVASVIPLSMLGAFILMEQFNISGNLLSLGAIDFGLVVDGAVVMVEGALAVIAAERITGERAMARVASEVGRPVIMAVLIIGVVYLPVLLLEGVEGKMFRPMAFTVLFAMGTALVLTFTWIPAVGSRILQAGHHEDPWLARKLRALYVPVLEAVSQRSRSVMVGLVVLLAAGAAVASTRGAEFVPRLEEGDLAIQLTRPPSVSLAEAIRGTTTVEQTLREFPEVVRVVSRTGSPDVATDVMGIEQSDVMVMLRPRSEWTTASDAGGLSAAIEPALRRALPGTGFGFTQPIEMRVTELIGGVRSDVGVKIFGDDLPTLRRLAEEVARVISGTSGAADVRIEPITGLRMLTIRPDPERLGRLGVRPDELAQLVESLRVGRVVGRLVSGERGFDVVMRMDASAGADPEPMRNLRVPLADGRVVLLGELADVVEQTGPAQVSREHARRRVVVEANVRGRDLASFVRDLEHRIETVERPPSYYFELGGEYENLARATRRLAFVVPGTLLVILLLLYLAFNQLRPALLIFVNVPAAASGGFFALAVRGLDLSISAAVGFLALFGVATLNGVVMLAAVRHRQEMGDSRLEAVRYAAAERLRPVVTTALVAALGFVPMAIATGTGAEVQRPLATVVIGGLVTSTLVTLLALPALYVRFGPTRFAARGGG